MNESKLTTEIIKTLKRRGGFWFKVHGSASQVSGLPDIIGCYRGRFIAFEVKVPGKQSTLSRRQRLMLYRIRTHGGISTMITSTRGALQIIQELDSELDQAD